MRHLATILAAATLALAGCSGGSSDGASVTTTDGKSLTEMAEDYVESGSTTQVDVEGDYREVIEAGLAAMTGVEDCMGQVACVSPVGAAWFEMVGDLHALPPSEGTYSDLVPLVDLANEDLETVAQAAIDCQTDRPEGACLAEMAALQTALAGTRVAIERRLATS